MSIGARYFKGENKRKVSGADMLPGVVLALSYGKCPIDPTMYIEDETPTSILIDWDNLGALIDQLALVLNKEFKPLTVGSTKQYLHALRNGHRANRNGIFPPLNVKFSEEDMTLTIPKRDYALDKVRFLDELPTWIF